MTTATRFLLLVAIWLALWSHVSVANLASGTAAAAAVMVLSPRRRKGTVVFRPVHAGKFALYFLVKLVQSTLVVARTVVAPGHRVHTGIVAIPLRDCSDALATVIADAISLTPGTLTLEIRRAPLTLYVHALDVRDVEHVRSDVRRLEVLAVQAFGTAAARAALTVDDTRSWRSLP